MQDASSDGVATAIGTAGEAPVVMIALDRFAVTASPALAPALRLAASLRRAAARATRHWGGQEVDVGTQRLLHEVTPTPRVDAGVRAAV